MKYEVAAISGVNGLLGGAIQAELESVGVKCIAFPRGLFQSSKAVEQIRRFLEASNIDLFVHCAANTDVEGCETDMERCFVDNTILSEAIAIACRQTGVKMVFISSTGVYGKQKSEPYTEYDPPNPTTAHHLSKFLVEKHVSSYLTDFLVIRTGWLFGGSIKNSKNFVFNRMIELESGVREVRSNADQYGNPSYVVDVASRVVELIKDGMVGIFNCVNTGVASRYDYVQEIIKLLGAECQVIAVGSDYFKRKAMVSDNEMAVNFKMRIFGYEDMVCWKDSLAIYIESVKDQISKASRKS